MRRVSSVLCALILLAACGSTGRSEVEMPLYVAGAELELPIAAAGEVPVWIERADLAFGPLYLCAGTQAGSLCDSARLEWLDSVVVDTVQPEPALAGTLRGVTGEVRSWMFDLGLSSDLTHDEPVVLEAAQKLGGVSLVLEGWAAIDGQEVPFIAQIALQQSEATERGVPLVRKSGSDGFFHEVSPRDAGLIVRFDPEAWLTGVDFRGVSTLERIDIEPGTPAYRNIRNAVLAGPRPAFEWLSSEP